MVRPRLVEEGEPLVGDWTSSDEDDRMEDMETEAAGAAVSEAAPPSAEASAVPLSGAPPSSLLRALGGKLPATQTVGRGRRRTTRYVIGKESGDKEEQSSSERQDMPIDAHAHSHVPSLPPNPHQAHASYSPGFLHGHHTYTTSPSTRTHIEIGADYRPTERMVGIEDHSTPLPLVVVDGANVAYAYAQARQQHFHQTGRVEPDLCGLAVVCHYFASIRVRVVLPASFVRAKPRSSDPSRVNAHMETDQFELLQSLQQQGKIVTSPPRDDDDAYCLTIAQRENTRALQMRQGQAPAYVLSNDMFRDAQERDGSGQLKQWLGKGDRSETGPGRISYTFVDLGQKDDYGDPVFDFVPNPRHPLVEWVENLRRQQGSL